MGLLVEGVWQDKWYDTEKNQGKFKREASKFRNEISRQADSRFKPESGRYHLYVSLACPWAHRTLIFRKLKDLESHISVSVVSPDMLGQGWQFDGFTGATVDHLYGFDHLHQLYTKADSGYSGRVTVPVLWDKQEQAIVNNESAEIIRIFNGSFDDLTGNRRDFYPEELREQIDSINDRVYHKVNNGVYKAGFATTQDAYEAAFNELFSTLDWLDSHLAQNRYLAGNRLTEADWRLFTTLVRFDAVYHGHFKCNLRRIADYANLSGYLRELYQYPGIAETVDFNHIKRHYYYSHEQINPTRIVPAGPEVDLTSSHNREHLQ
ncbi:glutathione S-transferase family protein [Bowmanella dokdonensis]|uniref:Glutathione S-transferase family protein n=1 Tax=Bowmanella dokdonensis TaxID=751969 RepID=A0A939IN67_9ALTE|nr:glutathione S-transferase family protein [Bowmanella dokdonensis]MBN7824520.1 glutathione S-transferase family protein [Bowmanella dokdonensis]